MVCLIQCRTYEVGHSGIHDKELLGGALLDVEGARDKRTHLSNYRAAQLEVQLLSRAQLQVAGISGEVALEVGYRNAVGMLIVDAQTASHVDVLNLYLVLLELCLQIIDAVAQRSKVVHVEYLRTDVEVKAREAHVLHCRSGLDGALHVAHGDAELVLGQPGCYLGMGVGTHVGVDAEAHLSHFSLGCGKLVDYFQLGCAFHVEAEDVLVETEVYLPVALAHTGIDNLRGGKTGFDAGLYLAAAHAVGTQPGLADDVEYLRIGIGLYCVVHFKALIAASLSANGVEGGPEQSSIVVVEWCLKLFKRLYGECSFHSFSVCLLCRGLVFIRKSPPEAASWRPRDSFSLRDSIVVVAIMQTVHR